MNTPDPRWQRLVAAACKTRDARDTAAPLGFATRVAAHAFATVEQPFSALLARFSWRALGFAALFAMVCVAANYSVITEFTSSQDDDSASSEIVSEVVNSS